MSEEALNLVRRLFNEALAMRQADLATDLVSPKLQYHNSFVQEAKGRDWYLSFLAELFTAFPDAEIHLEDLMMREEMVVSRFLFRGTQCGEIFGIAATQYRFEFHGVGIYAIEGEQITRIETQLDMEAIKAQLAEAHAQRAPE